MKIIKIKHPQSLNSTLVTLFLLGVSFYIVGNLYPYTLKERLKVNPQNHAINLKTNIVSISSLGYQRLIASLLWVETLLNSDTTHYKKNDMHNWMFLRFKTITKLDPYFYEAYLYGGIYLSIIKDDKVGAKYIYEHGLIYYPNDYYLNLNASFHYFYELQDIDKSIEHLGRIYDDPKAPAFLPSLYARLQSTRGDLQSALTLLIDLYNSAPRNSDLKSSYAHKIYAIKAEIDLNCLNSNNHINCAKKDFFGDDYYLDKNGKYKAKRDWVPFRIIKKGLDK